MITVEKELANLTNNFTDSEAAIRCWTKDEKEIAKQIFNKYYNTVEISDGRESANDKMCWIIAVTDLKAEPVVETLTEDILTEEEFDDNMNLAELNLDTIDDTDDIENADRLTVLKRRAAGYAEKWLEVYNQISELARKLDLTVSRDDDLNIELHKIDGSDSNVKGDLDFVNEVEKSFNDLKAEQTNQDNTDIDDSFGPSEFDDRAKNLKDEDIKEAINYVPQDIKLVESTNNIISNPDEIPLAINEIDDDF